MELGSDFTRNPLHYFSQIIIFFTSEVIGSKNGIPFFEMAMQND